MSTHDDDDLADIAGLVDAYAPDGEAAATAAFTCDDTGNAHRLAYYEGDNLRYITGIFGTSLWRAWTGTHWVDAHPGELMHRASTVMGRMAAETRHLPEPRRDEHRHWTAKSRSVAAMKGMLLAATGEQQLWAAAADFDTHPHLFNTVNGTLDLWEGNAQFRQHDRGDLLTCLCPTPYDADAESPLLHAFLDRFLPDKEERNYLLTTLAVAALVAGNPQRALIMILGPSTTGKTTLMKLLAATLGPNYVAPIEGTVFKGNQLRDAGRPDVLRALGARLVIATEASDAWELDGDQVKRMTGEDPIVARQFYSNTMVEQVAQFTPIIASNAPPRIAGADEAVRRRLRVALMDQVVPASQDTGAERTRLVNSVQARAAFLALLVRHYVDADGRMPADQPLRFAMATDEVYSQLDDVEAIVGDLIADGVLFRDANVPLSRAVRLATVYAAYRAKAVRYSSARDVLNIRAFGSRLRALGYECRRGDAIRVAGYRVRQSANDLAD